MKKLFFSLILTVIFSFLVSAFSQNGNSALSPVDKLGPDLIVSSAQIQKNYEKNNLTYYSVIVEIKNQGEKIAPFSKTKFIVFDDLSIWSQAIGTSEIPAGKSVTVMANYSAKKGENKKLIVFADGSLNLVEESNENNNKLNKIFIVS